MNDNLDEREFADIVEAKGGVVEALEYGLRASSLADAHSETAEAWRELEIWWLRGQDLIERAEALVEDALWS